MRSMTEDGRSVGESSPRVARRPARRFRAGRDRSPKCRHVPARLCGGPEGFRRSRCGGLVSAVAEARVRGVQARAPAGKGSSRRRVAATSPLTRR
jgi:hypothetical protein